MSVLSFRFFFWALGLQILLSKLKYWYNIYWHWNFTKRGNFSFMDCHWLNNLIYFWDASPFSQFGREKRPLLVHQRIAFLFSPSLLTCCTYCTLAWNCFKLPELVLTKPFDTFYDRPFFLPRQLIFMYLPSFYILFILILDKIWTMISSSAYDGITINRLWSRFSTLY